MRTTTAICTPGMVLEALLNIFASYSRIATPMILTVMTAFLALQFAAQQLQFHQRQQPQHRSGHQQQQVCEFTSYFLYHKTIAENKNLLLFLNESMILSLPSFADSGCQVALPRSSKRYGVAGTVTDFDGSPRLMVCFYDGCWLRGKDWIQNDSLDSRYSLLSSISNCCQL